MHLRTFSAQDNTDRVEGRGWRSLYWATAVEASPSGGESRGDVTITLDQERSFVFDWNQAAGAWTAPQGTFLTLTHDGSAKHFVLKTIDNYRLKFHDSTVTASTAAPTRLKVINDPYGHGLTFTYADNELDYIDDADGHRIQYEYVSCDDCPIEGKLQDIKVYKSDTQSDANLLAIVEFTYHDGDTDKPGGSEDDLLKVSVQRRQTSGDTDSTPDIITNTHYRYWTASESPGRDHLIKMIVRPENYERGNAANGNPLEQDDAQIDDFANVQYTYHSSGSPAYLIDGVTERGHGCSGCGSGMQGTTHFTWTVATLPSNYNDVYVHVLADLPNGAKLYADYNRRGRLVNSIYDDGQTSPQQWRSHYEYGDSGGSEGLLLRSYGPETVTAYNSSTYAVTLDGDAGVVTVYDYYGSGDEKGMIQKVRTRLGNDTGPENDPVTLMQIAYETSNNALRVKEFGPNTTGTSDDENWTFDLTFWDSDKEQLKQIVANSPKILSSHNGPDARGVSKTWVDDWGRVRWFLDAEGSLTYTGYDDGTGAVVDKTGRVDLVVEDVATSGSSPATISQASIDSDWDGTAYGFTNDDDVPYARGRSDTAVERETTARFDGLGRVRKITDPLGTASYVVYLPQERRFYPAWNTTTHKPQLPAVLVTYDFERRIKDHQLIETDSTFSYDGTTNEPTGASESFANSDLAEWSSNTYNDDGQRTSSRAYHNIPSSGSGAAFSEYYETTYKYDSTTGYLQYVIEQVAATSPQYTEQVTQYVYDILGRVIEVKRGVSDSSQNIADSPGTWTFLQTAMKRYYDDPDLGVNSGSRDGDRESSVGPGRLSWVEVYDGTSTVATRYDYDTRGHPKLVLPEEPPYAVMKYDSKDRLIAAGQYGALTNLSRTLDPTTDDDANRLSLVTRSFDYQSRPYATTVYADPSDNDPGDGLTTQVFYDHLGQVVAVNAPNSGIQFLAYNGLGWISQAMEGIQFDSAKYSSGVFDYPDDNEGIIEKVALTYNAAGLVQKLITSTLNHDDSNGMASSSDFVSTYTYNWYNAAEQLTDTAEYGTNSTMWKYGTAPTYGGSAPSRSDSILVTTYGYDVAGRSSTVTDPKSQVTTYAYDDLGRPVSELSGVDGGSNPDNEIKIERQYDGLSSILRYIADPDADNTFSSGAWTIVGGSDDDQVTEYAYANAIDASWPTEIRYPTGDGTVGSSNTDKVRITYHRDGSIDYVIDQNGTKHTYSYTAGRRMEKDEVTDLGTNIDGGTRARKWAYTSRGAVDTVTAYSDTSATTIVNQVKNTFNAFGALTKVEFDPDSAVGDNTALDTRAVEYAYASSFSGDNQYYRPTSLKYPDARFIWNGYSHTNSGSTFQDDINGFLSRPAQILQGTSGSAGDVLFETDYNGAGMVAKLASEKTSGWNGGAYRLDMRGATSGEYNGYDRFGRIKQLLTAKVGVSSTTTILERLYDYDRNGNPTKIENPFWKLESSTFQYDERDRLWKENRGYVDSNNAVILSSLSRKFTMTKQGATQADQINTTSDTLTHSVNSTNEISSISVPAVAGPDLAVFDDFEDGTMGEPWSAYHGSWSESNGVFNPTALGNQGSAVAFFDAEVGDSSYQVKINFPSDLGTQDVDAGIIFAFDGNHSYAVTINPTTNKISISQVTNNGKVLSSASAYTGTPIDLSTDYTLTVVKRQRHIEAWLGTDSTTFVSYDNLNNMPPFGSVGLFSEQANSTQSSSVVFNDFKVWLGFPWELHGRRWRGSAVTVVVSGELNVQGEQFGGEAVFTGHMDDDFIAQVDAKLNSGLDAALLFRYLDPDNFYRARLETKNGTSTAYLDKMYKGKLTVLDSTAFTPSTSNTIRVKCSGTSLKVWVNPGSPPGTATLSKNSEADIPWGAVALSGWDALFDNLKVAYDTNNDDAITSADDIVIDEDFASTSFSCVYDDAGNLTKDMDYAYVYDAWNNLVKVKAQNDADVVVGVYKFYADSRRASKTVTSRGALDGTTYFFYDGLREIEERDGSENVTQQYVWGQEYIDQLLMIRGQNGTWFAHQDANWNVIALTTPNGDVAEEVQYQPYGLPQVKRHIAFGDSDTDGDVDSTDNTAHTAALTTYNRLFDADLDGDVSNTSGDADKIAWDASYNDPAANVTMVVPNRGFSPTGNPFLFTGRRLDAETGLYFYRFRTYHPTLKVFLQRDPLGYGASGPSMYQYVGGMPTAAGDPLGLRPPTSEERRQIDAAFAVIQQIFPWLNLTNNGFDIVNLGSGNGETAWSGLIRLDYSLFHARTEHMTFEQLIDFMRRYGLDLIQTLVHELWHRNYEGFWMRLKGSIPIRKLHNPETYAREVQFLWELYYWALAHNQFELANEIKNRIDLLFGDDDEPGPAARLLSHWMWKVPNVAVPPPEPEKPRRLCVPREP